MHLLRGTSHASSKVRKVLLVGGGLGFHGSHVRTQIIVPILQAAGSELMQGCRLSPMVMHWPGLAPA